MNWKALRNRMPFQSDGPTPKSSSSKKTKSAIEVEPTISIPVDNENIAKILIIGETGSGKSTFINYLTNHFRGGTYDNPRIAIPTRHYSRMTESFGHCENDLNDVTTSKTDSCNQYLFDDSKTDKRYLFLDTPGLGDTRGVKQDKSNIETILNAINNLQGLTSVIIVVNGTMSRMTTNFRSVLLALRGNLPDVVLDNVILILSHVKRHQSTFDIKKILKMNGTTVYPYYMQNSAFAQDPKKWGTHEREHIERDWVESMEEIQQMLSTINTFETKSVAAFENMRAIRNAIKAAMHEAQLEITKVQRMHDEILIFAQAVKKYQGEEISYQDYTPDQTITVNEVVDAPYHSTICSVCSFVCHQNCSLQETTEVGNLIFQHCAAMNMKNNCTKCSGRCNFSQHYHKRKMMQTSEQKLTTVLHDIKAKFDMATKNRNDFEQKLNSAQGSRKLMEQVLRQKIDAVQAQCRELRKICAGFNLAQELYTLVEQLKIEAQTLTSLEARNQAEMVIRELNTFCQNLEAQEQNTTTSKSEMVVVDTGSGSEKTATKFIFNTQNKVQESNERVAAVDKLLQAQIKKKKTPAPIANSSDPAVYEPVDEEYQEEPRVPNNRPLPSKKEKPIKEKSQQPPALPKRLPLKQSYSNDDHSPVTMYTPDTRHGSIYSAAPFSSKATAIKYESLAIRELVDELHAAIAQNRSKAAIERELRNRAQGITCPMITASDRAAFARYTNKYSRMSPSEIGFQYLRLQKRVNSRLGNDEMDIEKIITIPSELLVELAALYTLFSSEEPKTDEDNIEEYEDTYPRPFPAHPCRTARPHPSNDYDHVGDRYTQRSTNIPSSRQDLYNSRARSGSCAKLYASAPPLYDDVIARPNERLPSTRSSSATRNGEGQTRDRRIDNPISKSRKPPVSYDARTSLDDDNNSSRRPTNSMSDLATMPSDKLLELYSRARKSEDNIQQAAIYSQLEKRCNGEDHRLMNDPMMEQTLNRYQSLETTILEDKLDAIRNEIRKLTNGGDATQIKNVSKGLLVRVAALTSILRDRSLETSF